MAKVPLPLPLRVTRARLTFPELSVVVVRVTASSLPSPLMSAAATKLGTTLVLIVCGVSVPFPLPRSNCMPVVRTSMLPSLLKSPAAKAP